MGRHRCRRVNDPNYKTHIKLNYRWVLYINAWSMSSISVQPL